ncbi:MAG: type II toxin-antitoxin system PemK/MazF family toxin [Desulfobacterales bacterium]|nr:MAG: type II toxin-antitoxin system PemK/MazF family toxin [Desulfobacterales bacterium]
MTYKSFEVVVVPFPFTDRKEGKRRPALVLSDDTQFNKPSGHTVLAMITSQKNPDWPLDTRITGNRQAGLTAPSKVRMKLFTLDNRLIVKKIGKLNDKDKKAVIKALQCLLVTELNRHRKKDR